jgi:uncharacterized protein YjbI with pentapeptide repeats
MLLRSILLVAVLAIVAVSSSCAQAVVIPAQEVAVKLASGEPVYYDGVSISGDLDLSSLPAARISGPVAITNSSLANATFSGVTFAEDAVFWGSSFGNASFDKASFLGQADFANASFASSSFSFTSFAQPAFFTGAVFRDNVSFEDAQFAKDVSFNGALFMGNANFNYSDFASYSYFSGAQFLSDVIFSDIDFSGALDFSAAKVAGKANFFGSRFSSAIFSNSVFSGPVQFGLAAFSGLSSFGQVVFADEANFNLARFSQATYFSEAEFQGLALFGLAKFEDIASLQSARFDDDLNFKGGSISTILLGKAEFARNSRIILNDTDFSRFKAHWNAIEGHVVWDPGAYLALVNNYHGLGWSDDEDDCYYQYRKNDQSHKEWGWSKIIDILAWLSCGYGVKPSYAGLWSLIAIMFFGLVYWKGDGIKKSAKPLHEPAEMYAVPGPVTLRNALFFSTMIFISRGPNEFLPVSKYRYYVILEGILGWLLLALFLVTLGRVMIR